MKWDDPMVIGAALGLAFLAVLFFKGYLDPVLGRSRSTVATLGAGSEYYFRRGVQLAIEEAHEEAADTLSEQIRAQVVASIVVPFVGVAAPAPEPHAPPVPPVPPPHPTSP